MGARFWKPKEDELIPETKGLAFLQTSAGYPVSKIVGDREWEQFLNETSQNESAFAPRGMYEPTVFNTRVLNKNLVPYSTQAALVTESLAKKKFVAAEMLVEGLISVGCDKHRELSMSEAWLGSNDGRLERLEMSTSMGAIFSKLGEDKKRGMIYHGDYVIPLCDADYDMVSDFDMPLYVWLSKMSLKDARLPVEKVMEDKGRVFQAGAIVSTITGRRLIGDFIGKFMEACATGTFIGIISMVLVRGGWHRLMEELGEAVEDDIALELKKVFNADLTKMDKNWLREQHWWCALIVGSLASNVDHARKISRHYERVSCSPTLVTIYGWVLMLTKGQPSGDIATVIFNTMVLVLIYMLAYVRVVPEQFHFFADFDQNLRLKALGDDSASCLSSHMRRWCADAGISYHELIVDTFKQQNFEITLEEKTLGTIDFVGHTTIVAHIGRRKFLLPALPERVVLSINEWRKKLQNADVYEEIANLSRYHASVERTFPYLWSDNQMMKDYFRLCWKWEQEKKRQYLLSPVAEIRANAKGVPTLRELAELYFGEYVSLAEIDKAIYGTNPPMIKESYKAETVGFGAGLVPIHGEYCGPGHPKVSDYTAVPVDPVDEVCQKHDLCYDIGADVADCDGAMAESLKHVDDPPGWYPKYYTHFADFWMNLVGDTDQENLDDVIKKTVAGNTRQIERKLRKMNVPGKLVKQYMPEIKKLAAKSVEKEVEKITYPTIKASWADQIEEEIEAGEFPVSPPLNKTVIKVPWKKPKTPPKHSPAHAIKNNKGKTGAARRVAKKEAKKEVKKLIGPKLPNGAFNGKHRNLPKKQAKRKVRRQLVALGNHVPARQLSRDWRVSEIKGKGKPHGIKLRGCEYLTPVSMTTSTDNQVGHVLYTTEIHPNVFIDSRLKQFAPLFQRYRFKKFRIIYESSISEFYSGKLLHYIDTDPTVDYSGINNSIQVLRNMSAHERDRTMKVCENSSALMNQGDVPQPSYFMDYTSGAATEEGIKRLAVQGKYILAVANPLMSSSGAPSYPISIGDLWIDYEVDMYMAALDATGGYNGTDDHVDMHNGIQTICWHGTSNALAVAANALAGWDWLSHAAAGYGSADGYPLAGTTTARYPNQGSVGENEVYLDTLGSPNKSTTIRGRGFGPNIMIGCMIRMVSSSTWTNDGTTNPLLVPVTNSTLVESDRLISTASPSEVRIWVGGTYTIDNPADWWELEISGNGPFTANLAATITYDIQIMLMQHVYKPPPSIDGCRWKAFEKKKGMIEALACWSQGTACKSDKCTVCPYGKLLVAKNKASHVEIKEESESEEELKPKKALFRFVDVDKEEEEEQEPPQDRKEKRMSRGTK